MSFYSLNNRKPFAARVNGKGNQCWMYKGPIHSTGYGIFHAGGEKKYSHRYVMEYLFGLPPVGLETDHLCGIKACVNPHHLESVTHAENIRRAAEQYIHRYGTFWTTNLSVDDVLMIREMSERGLPGREIDKLFPWVSESTIYDVVLGKTWKHLQS